ncbi:MAG: AEC family transporter [Lachnospiraceae bacterium]|nr:AEC family transporter [Lachnospiraceae bacterium]
MNTSLVLMTKLVSMMLVGAVGFAVIRIGLLEERDEKQLAKLSLYVLSPCLIIKAFQIDVTPERIRGYLLALVFSILVQGGFILTAEILKRAGMLGLVEELSIIYTNCGNLILPIVSMTLGEKMVFYGSAYQLSYNLLFWTHGAARLQDSPRIDWKKVLLNPNIIAIACGIFMLLARISLPGPVDTAIEMLANMVGPISMLVIGMTLAGSSLLRIFTDKRAYLVTFLRLIVLPLLALGVLRVSGFLARFPEYIPVFRISFLAISAPPGSNVAQVAVLYNKEPVRAGIYNLMGMMLCMFTIPLIDYLYMMCFG